MKSQTQIIAELRKMVTKLRSEKSELIRNNDFLNDAKIEDNKLISNLKTENEILVKTNDNLTKINYELQDEVKWFKMHFKSTLETKELSSEEILGLILNKDNNEAADIIFILNTELKCKITHEIFVQENNLNSDKIALGKLN